MMNLSVFLNMALPAWLPHEVWLAFDSPFNRFKGRAVRRAEERRVSRDEKIARRAQRANLKLSDSIQAYLDV